MFHRKIINTIRKNRIKKRFGENVDVSPNTVFDDATKLKGYNCIGDNANICGSEIGRFSYIGNNSNLSHCEIGAFCSISWDVEILVGEHPTNFVSTHPAFFSPRKFADMCFNPKTRFEEVKYFKDNIYVLIGNDVLINADVKIVCGVKIGDGAIVRAGAVITKDVEPYSIVGGVPARVIKKRFNDGDIDFLREFKWWEKDVEWLKMHVDLFDDVEKLRSFAQ